MTIALVAGQTISGTNTGGASTTLVLALPNNPTTGNLVVVGMTTFNATSPTISCADANSNAYALTSKTPYRGSIGSAITICQFYLKNAPANALKTITITSNVSIAINEFHGWIAEFSGADTASPFENDATANGGPGTTINTPSYTTLNDGDLLFASNCEGGAITSANSPFTGIGSIQNGDYSEYSVKATAGLQAVNYTSSNDLWSGLIAAYKAASGAPVAFTDQGSLGSIARS
jgi:hypothetical protein